MFYYGHFWYDVIMVKYGQFSTKYGTFFQCIHHTDIFPYNYDVIKNPIHTVLHLLRLVAVSLWAQSRDVSELRVSLRSGEKQWRSCRGFAAAFFVLPDEAILMAFWVSATACANTYKMTQKSNKNKLYLPSCRKSANSIHCMRCWGSHFPKLSILPVAWADQRHQVKYGKRYPRAILMFEPYKTVGK